MRRRGNLQLAGWVSVCLCICCHAKLYLVSLHIKSKGILHEIYKSFDSWIAFFPQEVRHYFAYHDDPQHFLLTEIPPTVLDKTINES